LADWIDIRVSLLCSGLTPIAEWPAFFNSDTSPVPKSRDNDNRGICEAEQLRCFVSAVASNDFKIFAHQQGICEAEGGDAVRDLADLFDGVRPRVVWIGFDAANGELPQTAFDFSSDFPSET
jgi:hypothetical protein